MPLCFVGSDWQPSGWRPQALSEPTKHSGTVLFLNQNRGTDISCTYTTILFSSTKLCNEIYHCREEIVTEEGTVGNYTHCGNIKRAHILLLHFSDTSQISGFCTQQPTSGTCILQMGSSTAMFTLVHWLLGKITTTTSIYIGLWWKIDLRGQKRFWSLKFTWSQ